MNTLKYEAVRTLTLFFIRVLPIVQNVTILLYYGETMNSVRLNNYAEVYDENQVLQYIEYLTPITDFIITYVMNLNLLMIIFLWILSITFRFCEYHRIFIYNSFICTTANIFFNFMTSTLIIYVYCIGMSALVVIGMLIALYLHQKHKGSM